MAVLLVRLVRLGVGVLPASWFTSERIGMLLVLLVSWFASHRIAVLLALISSAHIAGATCIVSCILACALARDVVRINGWLMLLSWVDVQVVELFNTVVP